MASKWVWMRSADGHMCVSSTRPSDEYVALPDVVGIDVDLNDQSCNTIVLDLDEFHHLELETVKNFDIVRQYWDQLRELLTFPDPKWYITHREARDFFRATGVPSDEFGLSYEKWLQDEQVEYVPETVTVDTLQTIRGIDLDEAHWDEDTLVMWLNLELKTWQLYVKHTEADPMWAHTYTFRVDRIVDDGSDPYFLVRSFIDGNQDESFDFEDSPTGLRAVDDEAARLIREGYEDLDGPAIHPNILGAPYSDDYRGYF